MREAALVLILLLSQSALANLGRSRSNAHEDYEESWMINFGGGFTTRVVSHNESSGNSNFTSIGEAARVSDLRTSLGLGKELLQQQTISFTLSLFAGVANGNFKSGEGNQSQFEEKLESVHVGGGLSVNYNLYLWGLQTSTLLWG